MEYKKKSILKKDSAIGKGIFAFIAKDFLPKLVCFTSSTLLLNLRCLRKHSDGCFRTDKEPEIKSYAVHISFWLLANLADATGNKKIG
jgi:hypothetical protein